MLLMMGEAAAGNAVKDAVLSLLGRGVLTPDLGGTCSTTEFTEEACKLIRASVGEMTGAAK
jgi:isocitrate/isopropylmalate dehydrogenase